MYGGATVRKAKGVFARRYPAQSVGAGKGQEQVHGRLAETIRTDAILSGDGTMWQKDLAPRQHSATPSTARAEC